METHTVTMAKAQTWRDNGEPLPSDLARLMVTCPERPTFASLNLSCWDGDSYSTHCGECGAWIHHRP